MSTPPKAADGLYKGWTTVGYLRPSSSMSLRDEKYAAFVPGQYSANLPVSFVMWWISWGYKKQAVSGRLRAEGITPSPDKEHWVWALGYLRDLEIRGYSDFCYSKLSSHNFIRQLLVLCLTFHKHRFLLGSSIEQRLKKILQHFLVTWPQCL